MWEKMKINRKNKYVNKFMNIGYKNKIMFYEIIGRIKGMIKIILKEEE